MKKAEKLMLINNYYNLLFSNELFGFSDYLKAKQFLIDKANNDTYVLSKFQEMDTIKNNSELVCYTDGSLVCNDKEYYAAGAFILYSKEEVFAEESYSLDIKKYPTKVSSILVEYESLLNAIRQIKQVVKYPKCFTIHFKTDSETMAKQLNLLYKNRNQNVRNLNRQCLEELKSFNHWSIEFVPREHNQVADKLAKSVKSS